MPAGAGRCPGPVRVERDGPVVTLTLDDPERGNALTDAMLAALRTELERVRADTTVRAVVLTAAGPAFCCGADVRDLADGLAALGEAGQPVDPTAEQAWRARLDALAAVIRGIRELPCAVVAALNGNAAGAGLSLALACDYRIALPNVGLNIAYGRLGAATDGGMSWFLPRLLGYPRALDVLLEQPVIRAGKAHALGLVNEIAAPGRLEATASAKAARYAEFAPHAVAASKQLLDAGLGVSLGEHLGHEHEAFLRVLRTADVRRGVAAVQASQWAVFQGD